ncbi:MAG TPA: ATP-binding domain-containing protein, partial [Rhodoglobus sp.]|nr:ATP-binding domain-containing protein [Rhodoglobus sp.]
RCPTRSMTAVGDLAQTGTLAGAAAWDEALRPHVGDAWRLEELTVNYRTPAQVVAVAERMALAHGVQVTRSRAVREGDWPVEALERPTLLDGVLEAVRADLDTVPGTIAVIASESLLPDLYPDLSRSLDAGVALGAAGLTRRVAVLSPQEAKGLEFDAVVVADPSRIVAEIPRGAAALYVAMTRPTQRLHVVTTGQLPGGIR